MVHINPWILFLCVVQTCGRVYKHACQFSEQMSWEDKKADKGN